MCFYVNSSKEHIAKKDITCYKILNEYDGRLVSPFMQFEYKIGCTYRLNKNLVVFTDISFYTRYIDEGFHSYSNKCRLRGHILSVYVKCIIPKGSHYYYNSIAQEYVSDSIRVIEIINKKE